MSRNPQNNAEWQEAVDAAEGMLALHAARCYGLVEGGPKVDVKRCVDLIRRGRVLGIVPARDSIERLVSELTSR